MNFILLDAATAPTSMTALSTILMVVIMLAVMYFFVVRPQKKQEKETANMLNNLSVGDEITTIGGVIGEIVSITDETVLISTSRDQTKIRFRKSAIKSVDVHANEKP
jgi:preprotein translocase subunit YajC